MTEDTYTVPQAQYEHMQNRIAELERLASQWQTQYEHAQERYEVQFHLNANLIAGLKEAQAKAWDEGYGRDEECGVPRTNPYREA